MKIERDIDDGISLVRVSAENEDEGIELFQCHLEKIELYGLHYVIRSKNYFVVSRSAMGPTNAYIEFIYYDKSLDN